MAYTSGSARILDDEGSGRSDLLEPIILFESLIDMLKIKFGYILQEYD